jgi:hypothetical protein
MRRGIIAQREEIEGLRARIAECPYDRFYDSLCRRCALVLESVPITEMHWQSAWAHGRYNAALVAARGVQGRILDLVMCDAIDTNPAYRSRAVEELRNLVNWSTWVDPCRSEMLVDLCSAEAAVATAIGLDWLWEELDQEFCERAVSMLNERIIVPYLKSVKDRDAWWYNAVNHWNAVINSACGIVSLALADTSEGAGEAHELCHKGLQRFFDDLGSEGGWDEGIGYWGYALRYVLLYGEACARLMDDHEVLHHRGMRKTGLFPIYFSPNGYPVSFGDSVRMPLHGALYLLDRYLGCTGIAWWLDKFAFTHDVNTTDWSQGLFMLFRSRRDTPPPAPELEPVKVYSQIGWAAMADRWPNPKFYVAAKAGDLSVSHAQRDMNSLQLQVDGEMLLIDLGHPPDEGSRYFSDARSEFYEIRAHSHNTVVVGGEDHRPDARGTVRESRIEDGFRWIVCDAGDACGEEVRFYRHIVLLCDGDETIEYMVVLDELLLDALERANLYWHVGGELEVDIATMSGRIVGKKSILNFALASNADADLSAGDHRLDQNRIDRYLDLAVKGSEHRMIASIFSQHNIEMPIGIQNSEDGLRVRFGDHTLRFVSERRHLVFEGIE